jgi:hypothetical protein
MDIQSTAITTYLVRPAVFLCMLDWLSATVLVWYLDGCSSEGANRHARKKCRQHNGQIACTSGAPYQLLLINHPHESKCVERAAR